MAKLVSESEQKLRKQYHDYLAKMKRAGLHKKAKTYYAWKKASRRTRDIDYATASRLG